MPSLPALHCVDISLTYCDVKVLFASSSGAIAVAVVNTENHAFEMFANESDPAVAQQLSTADSIPAVMVPLSTGYVLRVAEKRGDTVQLYSLPNSLNASSLFLILIATAAVVLGSTKSAWPLVSLYRRVVKQAKCRALALALPRESRSAARRKVQPKVESRESSSIVVVFVAALVDACSKVAEATVVVLRI